MTTQTIAHPFPVMFQAAHHVSHYIAADGNTLCGNQHPTKRPRSWSVSQYAASYPVCCDECRAIAGMPSQVEIDAANGWKEPE